MRLVKRPASNVLLSFSDIIAPEAAPTPAPTIVQYYTYICPATAPTAAPVAICFSVQSNILQIL